VHQFHTNFLQNAASAAAQAEWRVETTQIPPVTKSAQTFRLDRLSGPQHCLRSFRACEHIARTCFHFLAMRVVTRDPIVICRLTSHLLIFNNHHTSQMIISTIVTNNIIPFTHAHTSCKRHIQNELNHLTQSRISVNTYKRTRTKAETLGPPQRDGLQAASTRSYPGSLQRLVSPGSYSKGTTAEVTAQEVKWVRQWEVCHAGDSPIQARDPSVPHPSVSTISGSHPSHGAVLFRLTSQPNPTKDHTEPHETSRSLSHQTTADESLSPARLCRPVGRCCGPCGRSRSRRMAPS